MNEENRPDSYEAILEAAVDEFSEKGFSGMRMEHVAKRAGFNKSLVYRFFGDRESLFNAALESQFGKRESLLGEVPDNLGDMLDWWSRQTRKDQRFMRMILRESLDYRGDAPVMRESRQDYYGKQINFLRQLQESGSVAGDMDTDFLFLALLAITIAPAAIPQVCQLITGEDVDSEAFNRRWSEMLRRLAGHLTPTEENQ